MDNFDLLSIGDASLDVFMAPTESEAVCEIHDKDSLICFSYGEKIPVKNLEFSIGGNAANNAVGCSRLGIKTAIVLSLGDDNVGNLIVERLKGEGVAMDFVVRQPKTVSSYSTIINYSGERTIFTFHAPRTYEFPTELPATPWIYLTSMGETFKPFYDQFISWMKGYPETKLAFNPGSRQLRAGLAAIKEVIEATYVIYVNRKEAEGLTGMQESFKKEKELLKALCALGPKVSIITDGANGSFVYDGARFIKAEVLPVDAYERTGAGDAFGSGCISALIKGKTFEEAVLWGTANSASVIGYTGSQRGLICENEMPIWLERAGSSGVKVVEF